MAWTVLVISVAVSLDGLVVGAAYGAHRIRLGAPGLLIIGLTSAAMVTLALVAGGFLLPWLPAAWASRLGGALLIAVGVLFWRQRNREPGWADRDHSGAIDPGEAVALGLALATDAFAAGLGAALGGWAGPLLPATVGIAQMAFVYAGRLAGSRAIAPLALRLGPLPALMLIMVGLVRLV